MTQEILSITEETAQQVEATVEGAISDKVVLNSSTIPPNKKVLIDVTKVIRINSFGVRTWCNFLSEVCEKSESVHIKGVPPVLVQQANIIRSFFASAQVESYYTPWCCPDCENEATLLQQMNEAVPDSTPCTECDGVMEFDDIRASYLAFTKPD